MARRTDPIGRAVAVLVLGMARLTVPARAQTLLGPIAAASSATTAVAGSGDSSSPTDRTTSPPTDSPLHTFIVPKRPASEPAIGPLAVGRADDRFDLRQPPAHDVVRTTLGFGYVQGADWGSEIQSSGGAAGIQMNLDALITDGVRGLAYDHGSLTVQDPDNGWRVEAGDLSTNLRGAAEGLRLAWRASAWREPSIALYGTRAGLTPEPTAIAYRDQLRLGDHTLVDAEIGSDRSVFVASNLSFLPAPSSVSSGRRVTTHVAYRENAPLHMSDRDIDTTVALTHRLALRGSVYDSRENGARATIGTVGLRLPIAQFLNLTLERSITSTGDGTFATSTAAAAITAGNVHLYHRYQYGRYDSSSASLDPSAALPREAFQSTASYAHGPRFNVSLQLATEWRPDGLLDRWEQLETTMRLTAATHLTVATAFPRLDDPSRLHVRLQHQLTPQYSLEVEYGQLSNYQAVPIETDRPRFQLMLRKTFATATSMRGGDVQGRVLDQTGRPVAGARILFGPYVTDSAADGTYGFHHLPAGEYELTLNEDHLPADYAWDHRDLHLTISASSRLTEDLLVTPLNAIHGRVYVDRNHNGRFDPGEGVAGAVLRLGERATATDRDGGYRFYNMAPGRYDIVLDVARLPAEMAPGPVTTVAVTLDDGRPATGADLLVTARTKPILWKEIKR